MYKNFFKEYNKPLKKTMYKDFVKECNKSLKKMNRSLTSSFNDIDGDGVSNLKDCQPLNRKKQHSKPNILFEQEIKGLPIFFTGRLIDKTIYYQSILLSYH